MSFYIYENWTAERKAVIHQESCSHCNMGQGCHKNIHGDKNGRWHGPFESYQNALNFANNLRDRRVRSCGHCEPHKV